MQSGATSARDLGGSDAVVLAILEFVTYNSRSVICSMYFFKIILKTK